MSDVYVVSSSSCTKRYKKTKLKWANVKLMREIIRQAICGVEQIIRRDASKMNCVLGQRFLILLIYCIVVITAAQTKENKKTIKCIHLWPHARETIIMLCI